MTTYRVKTEREERPNYVPFHVESFRRQGPEARREVYILGIDLGPHIYVLDVKGRYEIWHVPAHNTFAGMGHQTVQPTAYLLVEIQADIDTRAKCLAYREPGYAWRTTRQEFFASMTRLAAYDQILKESKNGTR